MTVRIRLNQRGVRSLLRGPEIQRDLKRRADSIAAAADSAAGTEGGHDVEIDVGRNRARADIATHTPEAMYAEATERTLTRSVDAGR